MSEVIATLPVEELGNGWTLGYDIFMMEVWKKHFADRKTFLWSGSTGSFDDIRTKVPVDFEVLSHAEPDSNSVVLFAANADRDRFLRIKSDDDNIVNVNVFSSESVDDARAIGEAFLAQLEPMPLRENNTVPIRFWALSHNGPVVNLRNLEVPTWEEASHNYPKKARDILEKIVGWEVAPDENSGKLLLFHGPAGTGKTSAIRILAREWSDWCSVHYVVDPDRFFDNAFYMTSVLLDTAHHRANMWRLIIIEDCDELIKSTAKEQKGQAVSRLLNLCDGLVGQGLNILVLITTNEPVKQLHPAVIRPGRCLLDGHIAGFDGTEADEWREAHGLADTGKPATLAELYHEARSDEQLVTKLEVARTAKRTIGFARAATPE